MSRGPDQPVMLAPIQCITVELKDLADTQDFDLNGEIGALYGFEYTDDGYYKRSEISDPKNPKLEQLRNVVADNIDNFEYKLVRTPSDNKWHLIPIIDWIIKFEFLSPYVYFSRSERTFRKALNSGPLHVSLVPMGTSRREIEINAFKNRQYLLHRKDSVTKNATTKIQFIPEMPLPDTFTMIFDISVRAQDPSPSGAVGVSDNLMRGITIAWQNLDVEALRITVAIQNNGREIKSISSSDQVLINVNTQQLTELSYINLTHLDLIGFYYTDNVLSEDILQMVTKLD